jgi:hypothetical protein
VTAAPTSKSKMIKTLHNAHSRLYLNQWFTEDTLIVTDDDVDSQRLKEYIDDAADPVVVDLSMNSCPLKYVPEFLRHRSILTTEYQYWYDAPSNLHYFPFWLWMFSLRANFYNSGNWIYDASGRKNTEIMCLNRNARAHRFMLGLLLGEDIDKVLYTWGGGRLPDDHRNIADVGVANRAYNQCAVNLVTETEVDVQSLSEKTCKPFVARQIPIIVGPVHANQFLTDIGLDMFPDVVPWHLWDHEHDWLIRVNLVAKFVRHWIQSGTILQDYKTLIPRVEKNKTYFHSDQFRSTILKRMPNVNHY